MQYCITIYHGIQTDVEPDAGVLPHRNGVQFQVAGTAFCVDEGVRTFDPDVSVGAAQEGKVAEQVVQTLENQCFTCLVHVLADVKNHGRVVEGRFDVQGQRDFFRIIGLAAAGQSNEHEAR